MRLFPKNAATFAWRIGAALLLVAVATGAWPLWLHLTSNFHSVIPGELYRSAQPTAGELREWVGEHGIRSVLNLRGAHDDTAWYRAESDASHALGITLASFPLSASKNPGSARMADLVALMRRLPKPLLIHCQGGADRTGLASALYVAAIAGSGEEAAERQLSFEFGHIGLPVVSAAWPMNEAWEQAEQHLGYGDS